MAFDLNALIPEGWEIDDYRVPEEGETYLATSDSDVPFAQVRRSTCAPLTSSIILKRKRWRADHGWTYFFIDGNLRAYQSREDSHRTDNRRYEVGNYFRTEGETEAAAEKIRDLLKAEAE